MLLDDARDFLRSEKWYADRGIPFRRGYLLHGVPGSGKSSLIHALAGQLQLDIYVVSLSASWISDNTLTTLMGRVPARCVLLLEDLDAAFVRSTTRDDDDSNDDGDDEKGNNGGVGSADSFPSFTSGFSSSASSGGFSTAYGYNNSRSSRKNRHSRSDGLSEMNTLSLSGLLNALDGVAASEGRLLFATTNHLERLDPALCRPGRMDVWVEFKNASRWQAEALFRNFFPSEEEEEISEEEVEGLDIDKNVQVHSRDGRGKVRTVIPPLSQGARDPSLSSSEHNGAAPSSLWSLSASITSSASSLISGQSSPILLSPAPPLPRTFSGSPVPPPSPSSSSLSSQFGATNTAYLPPPPEPKAKAKPLDKKTLALLAKKFADGVPDEEFSVASLQGCMFIFLLSYCYVFDVQCSFLDLLKHKAQPEAAADGIELWVQAEREMRERLQREKEARETREKALVYFSFSSSPFTQVTDI